MKARKVLALATALVMVFGSFSMAFGQTAAETFPDIEGHWAKTALVNAVDNGLLKGDNGYIMPDSNLTRAQMAAVVNRAFGATQTASLSGYTDVPADAWYYSDMAKAVKMKTFMGSNGLLTPEANITREQAFVVLARGIARTGAPLSTLDKFSDAASISEWARDGIASLVAGGYVNGSNGMLNPQMNITRAEFAQIMDNILKNYIKTSDTYTGDYMGNLAINVPEVTLKGTTINGGLLIGDGVGTGSVSLDGVTVTGRMVVRGGGENSIKILGNSNIQNITIANVGDTVRVYAEDGTEIPVITIMGGSDVIIEGHVGTINVISDNITVTATNATIGTAMVSGANSKIIVGDKSTIGSITVTGAGTVISGDGEVTSVAANANNVVVNTIGTKVTAGPGTTGVKAGTTAVKAGTTETVVEEVVMMGGGGGPAPELSVGTLSFDESTLLIDGDSVPSSGGFYLIDKDWTTATALTVTANGSGFTSTGTYDMYVSIIVNGNTKATFNQDVLGSALNTTRYINQGNVEAYVDDSLNELLETMFTLWGSANKSAGDKITVAIGITGKPALSTLKFEVVDDLPL